MAGKGRKRAGKKKGQNGRGRQIKGKGDYTMRPLRTLGRGIGARYGYPRIGGALGAAADELVGSGDYQIVKNSLLRGGAFVPIPKFGSAGRRGVRVCEREFIGNIGGTQTFSNTAYPLNPGLGTTFPWLSTIAAGFEEYEFDGLVFEFVPLSATFSGSGQGLGVMVLSTDYDPTDQPFNNKMAMENADYAVSGPPTSSIIHPIECDPREKVTRVSYVRSGALASNQDPKFYDLGVFQIASDGFPATTSLVGELWVSYDVVLYKKQLNTGTALSTLAVGGTPAPGSYWGAGFTATYGSLPLSTDGLKTLRLYTPATASRPKQSAALGDYYIRTCYPAGVAAFTPPGAVALTTDLTVLAGTNVTSTALPFAESPAENSGTNVANPCFWAIVRVTGPNPSISWTTNIVTSAATVQVLAARLETCPLQNSV